MIDLSALAICRLFIKVSWILATLPSIDFTNFVGTVDVTLDTQHITLYLYSVVSDTGEFSMKLTIEATDPVEIAQLAGYLAGVRPSSGLDVSNGADLAQVKIFMPQAVESPAVELPAVEQTSAPTDIAQTATKQGAGKRGRPKKSPELSTVATSTDASADYAPATDAATPPADEAITSPADSGVEYESTDPISTDPISTDPVPTIEEVRAALIKLSDAKGVPVAAQLAAEYAESRKAQDVPENKRAELIAKAEALKAE